MVGRATPQLPPPDASGRVAYLGQFPADRLAPGRYMIRAVARQGTLESTTATSFRVVQGEAAPAAARPSTTLEGTATDPSSATP